MKSKAAFSIYILISNVIGLEVYNNLIVLLRLQVYMQVIVEIPYVLIQTTYYCFIVYAMVSFEWTAAKFIWFYFINFISFLYFTYYGMMTVSITPNHQVAAIFAAAFYLIFNLFSGFYIPRPVKFLQIRIIHICFILVKQLQHWFLNLI